MSSSLKSLLDSWETDLRSAQDMTVHLSQLGLPGEHMPSNHAIRASCLALQAPEVLQRLRQALLPREQELVEYGVLHAGQPLKSLRGGEMMVLNNIIDRLHIITEQIDTMLERAYSFVRPDSVIPGHPAIRIGTDKVEGHKHQLANLNIRLKDVDRLLICTEGHGVPRVLIFPPESVRVCLPIIEGELLLYAENALGASVTTMQFSEVKYV